MVHVENQQWNTTEHSLFASNFEALLILNSISGDVLDPSQHVAVASHLTESVSTGIQSITVNVDPFDYMEFVSTVEGEHMADALSVFAKSVVRTLAQFDKNPEHLELVAAHIVYEQQLIDDQKTNPYARISDKAYGVEIIPSLDIEGGNDGATDDPATDIYEIFAKAVDAVNLETDD